MGLSEKTLLFFALSFMLFTPSALAYLSARSDYTQTIVSTQINGHLVELVHENSVEETGICIDFGGWFPVFYSNQRQYLAIDGVEYPSPSATTGWYNQWDNWEHCPRLNDPGTNREHCVSTVTNFYPEAGQFKIQVRNYGGDCQPDQCTACNNNDFGPYAAITTLSVPYPGPPQQCVPGSGSCCTDNGQFSGSGTVCQIGLEDTEQCVIGVCDGGFKHRYGTQYCSGNSASCNGNIDWSNWGSCDSPPNIQPETCNDFDDDCDGQIDDGLSPNNCPSLCTNEGHTWLEQGYTCCGDVSYEGPRLDGTFGPEECDGYDNDCDGQIDEGFNALQFYWDQDNDGYGGLESLLACMQPPGASAYTGDCDDNNPEINPGQLEVCDAGLTDEDCDGRRNEGCLCVDGRQSTCGISPHGQCTLGTQTCANGQWEECIGSINPSEELCDDFEGQGVNSPFNEDCDWSADPEDTSLSTETCSLRCNRVGGTWMDNKCCGNSPLERPPFGTEICDNYDNDCDGQIDEEDACPPQCSDGTLEGNCSSARPRYCANGSHEPPYPQLVHNAQICGCPEGQEALPNGFCQTVIHSPVIERLAIQPSIAQPNQSITFRLLLEPGPEPISIQLYYRVYENPGDFSDNPADYTEPVLAAFYPLGMDRYNSSGEPDPNGNFYDAYEGTLASGFNQTGYHGFRGRVITAQNQTTDIALYTSGGLLRVVPPGTSDVCSTIYEAGDPGQKMNIFFLRDTTSLATVPQFNEINILTAGRLQNIPPFPANNLRQKFNFYQNDTALNLHCEPNASDMCNNAEVINAATMCNKPVKTNLGTLNQPFSDKIVIYAPTDDPSIAGRAYISGYTTKIGYFNRSDLLPPFWSDVIVHELGHNFGFYHTHDYHTGSDSMVGGSFEYLGCDSPRNTIMCYANPIIRSFETSINNRISCYNRNDIPADRPPLQPDYCSDEYASDAEYLIGHLNQIP